MSEAVPPVAYHEAGHAVIAHLLRARVDMVTIEADERGPGGCGIEVEPSASDARVMIAFAGADAENWFCGNGAKPSLSDIDLLFRTFVYERDARNASDEEQERMARHIGATLRNRARDMIDDHFLTIHGVARYLAKHRRLNRDMFLEAFDAARSTMTKIEAAGLVPPETS